MFEKDYYRLPNVTLRLSTGKNDKERVPMSSGLNWGQRPGREQNQAYLPVPADIQKNNFFPDTGIEFEILTDDGFRWRCARRQANGKAIHTIENNSTMGLYFRKRIGLEPGDLITLGDLLRYGRTSVTIYKKSTHLYLLEFSIS